MTRIYTGWPGLDALSAMLFGRKLSQRWTGRTSASDNVFDDVQHLLEIYATVCDNEEEVGSLAKMEISALDHFPTGSRAVDDDLMRLSGWLASTSAMFASASKSIEKLAHTGKL